ncbi:MULTISPECIES: hypothetical protein [Methylomonas]|uniref:Uncharacterized protein n=1 Tax=Methylomonas koyamae TaxID=702114 RepID=A0A177P0T7_9GAMM|nr:hypothetical protein [Methylomonas koyamae]OAI23791.1 hypothetical protein A1355_21460 [Methylomonas koyamae]
MDFYVDHTPYFNPVVATNIAPFQPRSRDRSTAEIKGLTNQTAFVTKAVDLFATTKGPLAQTKPPIPQLEPYSESTPTLKESVNFYSSATVVSQPSVEIDQIAKQRVRLMAAKYASGNTQSSEILARLEILNSRLSERAPLVSKEQVIALEGANAQLARIRAAREERAKRLGIPAKL